MSPATIWLDPSLYAVERIFSPGPTILTLLSVVGTAVTPTKLIPDDVTHASGRSRSRERLDQGEYDNDQGSARVSECFSAKAASLR